MEIYVRGIGPVGGFGSGTEQLARILDGTLTVSPEIFSIKPVRSGQGGHQAATKDKTPPAKDLRQKLHTKEEKKLMRLPCFRADTSRLNEFFPQKKLRRIDHLASMALLGACLAVKDAQPSPESKPEPQDRTGLILATGYGALDTSFSFIDSFLDRGDQLSKPTFFSNSVHNAAAAYLSILLGIRGPCLSISQFDLSVPSAIMTAKTWINEGRIDSVLVGGVDQYNDVIGYAAASMGAGTVEYPVTLGEGGCFFLLSRNQGPGQYARLTDVEIFNPVHSPFQGSGAMIMETRGYGKNKPVEMGHRDRPHKSFESLYGKFPTSMALDMAVACMGLKNKNLMDKITGHKETETIFCITPGNDNLWGKITLEPNLEEL